MNLKNIINIQIKFVIPCNKMVILNCTEYKFKTILQNLPACSKQYNTNSITFYYLYLQVKCKYIKLCIIHKIYTFSVVGCFHKIDFTPAVLAIDKLTHCNALRN